jgi:hypothetical protein
MAAFLFYPRPEYPRPDRQRGSAEGVDWLNLNGPWQFRFDPERRGLDEQWFRPDGLEWREQIIVPFCWESLAAWGESDSAGNDNYYSTRVFRNPLEVTRENHRSAPRYEVGWYRRSVDIPQSAAWQGRRVILTIGAADFFTDCWCNGQHLGHHEGGYIPFEFDLTDALVAVEGRRRAHIVLRVEDPMNNSEQPVGKQWRWYTTTSGIWQTVYVEPRSPAHIDTFRFVTDIDAGTVRCIVRCAAPGAQAGRSVPERREDSRGQNSGEGPATTSGAPGRSALPPGASSHGPGVPPSARQSPLVQGEVEVQITAPDGQVQSAKLEVRNGRAEQTLKLSSRALWDPNSPNLYQTVLRLRTGGEVVDTVHTYFGLRKIDFELAKESGVPVGLRVNGQPRYLRGALYQSYHPEGVYTASSVETLKDDIAHAKRFGFNFLRVHIKIDDPLLLYWADKLGMLLMADMPNFGEGGDTPLGRQRFETMMHEAIDRDFNHPAIFAWCLFNETWGFGGQTGFIERLVANPKAGAAVFEETQPARKIPAAGARPGMTPPQVWVQQMWELAKELDPSRLVEDMSVCHWDHLEYYLHCDTDINSWHFYINDYTKAKAHIAKIVNSTFVGSSFNYVPGFLHKGQPLINSEYGGIGALDGDRDVSWSFKFLTNELRRYQQIAAYIYTELHDVEWEYNGFLNYDRTPKVFGYDPRIVNESNALPVDAPPVQRVPPGTTVRLEVSSAHFSTRRYENICLYWELAGVDTRGRFYQDLARGRMPIPFPHRKVAHAHTLELRLPEEPMLCTLFLSARTADSTAIAQNFLKYFVSVGYPPAREETARALILRGLPANWAQAEWSGGVSDRDKARAEDCCYGLGHGFFEWNLPLQGADLTKAHCLRVLCEASSHRSDSPQTDNTIFSTSLQLQLNDVRLYENILRNHPHDSRGVLSYWRGGLGAYGYLVRTIAEDDLLREIVRQTSGNSLRLRCEVPADAPAQGGLTLYGAECGRFPVCPTVIVEW